MFSLNSSFKSDSIDNDSVMTLICNFENPIGCVEIEEEKDEIDPFIKLLRLFKEKEKEIQPHEKLVEVINLGTKDDKKEIKVGTLIGKEVQ